MLTLISFSTMTVTASRGGHVSLCQVQVGDGHLQSAGGGTVREVLASEGTAVMRECGGETGTERGIGTSFSTSV